MHDVRTGLYYIYIWTERMAGMGSNNVMSVLHYHFKKYPTNAKTKIIIGDNCGGQLSNYAFAENMLAFTDKNHPSFCCDRMLMVFMRPGHSFLKVDGVTKRINKKKNNVKVLGNLVDMKKMIEVRRLYCTMNELINY